MTQLLELSPIDREQIAGGNLPPISLVDGACARCHLPVLIVRVGLTQLPVLLDLAEIPVVRADGHVAKGHPEHDSTLCTTRAALVGTTR